MSKIDVSPKSVSVIQNLQQNADNYAGMLECACDYIIECTDTLSSDCNPAAAIGSLRNLRELKKLMEQLMEGGKE